MSYPEGVIQGVICGLGALWDLPNGKESVGCHPNDPYLETLIVRW